MIARFWPCLLLLACGQPPDAAPVDIVLGDDRDVWLDSDDVAHVYFNEIWTESMRRIRLYAPDGDYPLRIQTPEDRALSLDAPKVETDLVVPKGHRIWLGIRVRPAAIGAFRSTIVVHREAPRHDLLLVVEGTVTTDPVRFSGATLSFGDCLPIDPIHGTTPISRTPGCLPANVSYQGAVVDPVTVVFASVTDPSGHSRFVDRDSLVNPIFRDQQFSVRIGLEPSAEEVRSTTVTVQVIRPDHSLWTHSEQLYFVRKDLGFQETALDVQVPLPLPEDPLEVRVVSSPYSVLEASWDSEARAVQFHQRRLYPEELPPVELEATLVLRDRTVALLVVGRGL